MLDKQIEIIKSDFHDSPDIIFRKIKIGRKEVLLIYNTSVSKSDNINDFILKRLTNFNKKLTRKNIHDHLESELPENVIEDVKDKNDLYIKRFIDVNKQKMTSILSY